MKPATICYPFVGNLLGGSHVSSLGLIERLDRKRFSPLVFLQHDIGPIAALFSKEAIPAEQAPAVPELQHGRRINPFMTLRLAALAPRLAHFLRRRNVDIVHCNDGRTLAVWALPARLAGAKLLWHNRGAPDSIGLRLVAPAIATYVVAVSNFSAPAPGWYSAAARTHVIHSPFDTDLDYDRGEARKMLLQHLPQTNDSTRVIAFSGALIDRKRPLLFVEAIAALRRLSPHLDIRGILLGESLDGMGERVNALASRLGIDKAIHLMGYRTPGPYWLAGSDILMVPAIHEPFGRTLIEAMLVGTPVVATASGGNVEAIRDGQTGLLVPPEDAVGLAKACQSLLESPTRMAALAKTAQADARLRFGMSKHAEAIMALYTDMLASTQPPAEETLDRRCASATAGHGNHG